MISRAGSRIFGYIIFGLLAASAAAQTQDPARGWRRVDTPPPVAERGAQPDSPAPAPDQPEAAAPPTYIPDGGGMEPQLTLRAGTYLTVRVNQPLSSDHNQAGDAFSTSLVRPLVVDGIVVAQTGQLVGGQVVEAQRASRATGVSRLGLQLTELTLVDGQQVPIQSQMVTRNGPGTGGRDASVIAATTTTGAVIGTAADWGRGAVIGAGLGALAGVIGVMLTPGAPTVVYPEAILTFRLEAPVTISTQRAPQAFRHVEPGDYERANQQAQPGPPAPAPPPPPPYYYGPIYGPPYPYWGGSFGIFWGPTFYRGGFHYRRFYR